MLIGCFSLQGETGMTGEGGQVGERVKALFSSRPADFCLMLAVCVCVRARFSRNPHFIKTELDRVRDG